MYEIDKVRFGAFVAAQRKKKGWTQKELAESEDLEALLKRQGQSIRLLDALSSI